MSRFEATRVHMYRFNDQVAMTFEKQGDTTETIYMEAALAYMVAAHMKDIHEDIEDRKFTKSSMGTWLAEQTPAGASIRKSGGGVP